MGAASLGASEKAYLQHCRIVHKETVPIKNYIDDSGVCPECLTNFQERFRVVHHLTDKRRPKCALLFPRDARNFQQHRCRCGRSETASVSDVLGTRDPRTSSPPALLLQHRASERAMSTSDVPQTLPSPRTRHILR